MATTVDHLAPNRHVRVIRPFTDADGRSYPAGYAGVISRLDFDTRSFDIHLEVSREGGRDTMRFNALAREGPGNGRMREFFEVGDHVAPPREPRAGEPPPLGAASRPVAVPHLDGDVLLDDPDREEDAIARVWALAARKRFDEAREQLVAVSRFPDRMGGERARWLAGRVAEAAVAHAWDEDEEVHQWLRHWSLDLWYQWGSGATSGGDGAERGVHIRSAEAEWARLDAARRAWRESRSLP